MVAGRRFRDSSDNFIVELSMKSVKDGIKGLFFLSFNEMLNDNLSENIFSEFCC